MDLQITGRNMEVTERLDEYVRRKASRLDRYLPSIVNARMDLSVENTKSAADRQVAQLTIRNDRGTILRVEERTGDMFTSIDAVMDKMHRQIARFKGKRQRARRNAQPEDLGLPLEDLELGRGTWQCGANQTVSGGAHDARGGHRAARVVGARFFHFL